MYKLAEPQRPVNIFIGALYACVGMLLVLLVVLHGVTKIPFASFTADPAATFGFSPIYGYISNLGILMWSLCVSVCFFSAAVLNIRKDQRGNVAFLTCFGILTSILMFDDLFMFHESVAPWYFNVPEKVVLAFYGIYATGCFYHFRKIIFTRESGLFALSVAALGMSVVIDQFSSRYYIPGEYLFEDGLKFVGIASWLSYFVSYSFAQIMAIVSPFGFSNQSVIRKAKRDLFVESMKN